MIPESFVQDLLARVDIVDVVERYVPLKKAGANYSACCPFHSEKTPSFTVSPSKQFYHCFGCGAHGSAIGFLMQHAGIGFVDAVEELASSVGLQVPHEEQRRAVRAQKAPLTDLMAQAARFYREQLKSSPKAIEYLKGRGLSGEIAARFGIGYAPDGWQGLEKVFPNYADPALAECGLVIVNEQGRRYDRFRDRVMFPILDQRGNVVGFGGRVLGSGEPKYLNSPETPIFEKGRELYGLPQARKAIHEADTVLVVEGYMDVVGLAQSGVENVVATLGTAATDANVQRLLKTASRVVFCFDRDAAGDRAAWRAMEVSLAHLSDSKAVEILQFEGDQDPDEYIREHGRDKFLERIRSATRLSQFMMRQLLNRAPPTSTAEGRAHLVDLAKPLLQKISAPGLRLQLVKELAREAEISPGEVEAQCELRPLARTRYVAPQRQRPAPPSTERRLLEIVLQRPAWAARLPLDLVNPGIPEGAALLAIADGVAHGRLSGSVGNLLEHFRGTPHEVVLAGFSSALTSDPGELEAIETVFNDAIDRLRSHAVEIQIRELTEKARSGLSAEDRARLSELLASKAKAGVTRDSAL